MDHRKLAALHVMEKLEQAGYQAYLVGGCVRDECLGKIPQDYDVTTDARPEQVMEIFEKVIPTGIRHGTVMVVEQKVPVEVTTFRTDGNYLNHRQPEKVEFVQSLKEDLKRRDFTMNAMAKDRNGRIIDYFDGRKDLDKGIIRTVGNPSERFQEDALRMLRAIRFANQFRFELDPATEEGICRHRDKGSYLSVERVTAELNKMFDADTVSQGFRLLFQTRLIHFLPPFRRWDLPDEAVKATPQIDPIKNRTVRWAYLLCLCGTRQDQLAERLRQLKLSKKENKEISACFSLASRWKGPVYSMSREDWCRILLEEGPETVVNAANLAKLTSSDGRRIPSDSQLVQWWNSLKIHQVRELKVSGRDFIRHCGWEKGPWIGKVLQVLLEQVALGKLPNEKEILLKEGCKIGALHQK
jgi:tRNA nucleotidyltransferase (CCA-adding enzyme)